MCEYGVAATSADESPRSIRVKGHAAPIGMVRAERVWGFVCFPCRSQLEEED